MVEISLSGSGEGPGWVTAPGYSTTAFLAARPIAGDRSSPYGEPAAGRFQAAGGAVRGWPRMCAVRSGPLGERGRWGLRRLGLPGAGSMVEGLGALGVVVDDGLVEAPFVVGRV